MMIAGFIDFHHSLQANVAMISHDRFLPNAFQFVIHQSSYHSMLYRRDTDVVK
jgi:hypothetical protein